MPRGTKSRCLSRRFDFVDLDVGGLQRESAAVHDRLRPPVNTLDALRLRETRTPAADAPLYAGSPDAAAQMASNATIRTVNDLAPSTRRSTLILAARLNDSRLLSS